MRKINLLIVGLIAAFIVSCNQSGKKTETDSRATVKHLMVLSQKDTIQVLDLTNQFMTAVKEQRYADAAMMLHEMKADDPFAQPELLDNEQLKSVLQRLKAFPIYDYTISDCIFKEAFDNEVRCKVVLFLKQIKRICGPMLQLGILNLFAIWENGNFVPGVVHRGTVHFTLLHNNIEEFPAETAYTYH